MKKIVHYLLLLISSTPLLGQQYVLSNQTRFELLSVKDGLPANSANCIIQDKKGYIWIGSFGGFSKYDGYTFKNYRQDKDNSNHSLVNYVMVLFEDSKGYIWIGTLLSGLQRFDPRTETFTTYPNIEAGGIDNYITAIKEDAKGNIWVGTTNGLYQLNSENGTFQPEDISINHYPAKAYSDTLLQYLDQSLNTTSQLAGFTNVGGSQKQKKTFTLQQKKS